MREVDPGHVFDLDVLDGRPGEQFRIHFVKREGEKYPGNIGAHSGPTTQEYIRAILARTRYVNRQLPCAENDLVINGCEAILFALENRASRIHGEHLDLPTLGSIELLPTCPQCRHINCHGHT